MTPVPVRIDYQRITSSFLGKDGAIADSLHVWKNMIETISIRERIIGPVTRLSDEAR
jgi:hypothetical protein